MAEVSMNGISFTIVGDTRNAIRAIKNLKASLRDLNSDLQTVGDRTERTSTRLKSALKVLSKAGGAVVKPFKSGVTAVLTKATSRVNAFAKGVKKLTGGIGRIAMYRAFRSIIRMITDAFREGTKNLYAWSSAFGGTFAKNMDDAAASMLYFKNSVGAAWSPLMNVLAPALRTVTDAAVELLNVINQLLARLTGQSSWTRAIRKATEYGDAVGGAGAAAKEAMRYLAPFDELNVLPSDKGSGGGGGSATDTSGMFEEVLSFDTGIADFADKVKEAINSENWTGLGVLLGNKVNEIVDYLEENKVFENAGKKIGKGINAWFTTKYWTLQTINFTNIGSNIATALNNAIGEIDFNIIGRSITQGFTNTIDFLIGFLGKLDWVSVGNSARDLLVGAFNQITQWAQKINWSNVGTQLYNGLKDAIKGLDLSGIATSFFTMLGTALGAASAMIKSIASNIWTAIKSYFLGFIKDENGNGELDGGEILEGLLKGIDNAIKNIASWVKDHIWTPFVNGFKSTFGIKSPAETMEEPGQMVAEGILKGIAEPFIKIYEWIKTKIFEPIVDAIKSAFGIGDNSEGGTLWAIGKNIGEDILGGMLDSVKKIGDWIDEHIIDPIKEKFKDFSLKDLFVGEDGEEITGGTTVNESGFSGTSGKFGIDVEANVTGFNDSIPTDKKKTLNWTIDANKFKDDIKTEDKLSKYWTANFTKRTVSTGVKAPVNVTAEMKKRIVAEGVKKPVNVSALMKKRTVEDAVKKPINVTADYKKRIIEEGVKKPINVSALMKKRELTEEVKKPISTTANFSGYSVSVPDGKGGYTSTPILSTKAKFTSTEVPDWLNPTINVTARIVKTEGGTNTDRIASGGVFTGKKWHNIAHFDTGGLAKGSQLFWAREKGPELVGTLGGHTAVMNNDQIVASVSYGVQRAIAGIRFQLNNVPQATYASTEVDEDAMYRAMLRALNDADVFPEEIDLDGDVVYRKMVLRNRLNTRMTGVNAMASVMA